MNTVTKQLVMIFIHTFLNIIIKQVITTLFTHSGLLLHNNTYSHIHEYYYKTNYNNIYLHIHQYCRKTNHAIVRHS